MSIGELLTEALDAKKPETRTAELCLDPDLAQHWGKLTSALRSAEAVLRIADGANYDKAQSLVAEREADRDEFRAQIEPSLLKLTFAPIDPTEFDTLKTEHPAERAAVNKAKAAGERKPEWNVATFGPAIVAAMCVKVEAHGKTETGELSLDDAKGIWTHEAVNDAERDALIQACLGAQFTRTVVDLGKD